MGWARLLGEKLLCFVCVRDLGVYCVWTCVYMDVCVKYACVCIHPHTLYNHLPTPNPVPNGVARVQKSVCLYYAGPYKKWSGCIH